MMIISKTRHTGGLVLVLLVIVIRIRSSVNEAPSDLAANRSTWQNTVWGGESSFAVDGVLTTRYESCIHTEPAPAVWSVDLSTPADIFYVEVLNRAEGGDDGNNAHWLSDFLVTVSNIAFPVTYDQLSSFTRCGQYSGYPAASHWGRVTCSPGPVRGRYVYVSIDNPSHYLVMCEVKVLGVPVWNESGYKRTTEKTDCGYEYQIGTVTPATWAYHLTRVQEPNSLECFTRCNKLANCTGFSVVSAAPGTCDILLEP